MDNPKTPHSPDALLGDLESIRALLDEQREPPVLNDSLDDEDIPLLSEIVQPPPPPAASTNPPPSIGMASADELRKTVQNAIGRDNEINRLDSELRAAAQLLLQDVIDDFVPQIEAELRRRLNARLDRLIAQKRR